MLVCAVLESAPLVEHALRNTLVADALSLQFRLPPSNMAPPAAKATPAIANGAPTVDTLVVTSVWAVHILRTLCQVARIPLGQEIAGFATVVINGEVSLGFFSNHWLAGRQPTTRNNFFVDL